MTRVADIYLPNRYGVEMSIAVSVDPDNGMTIVEIREAGREPRRPLRLNSWGLALEIVRREIASAAMRRILDGEAPDA